MTKVYTINHNHTSSNYCTNIIYLDASDVQVLSAVDSTAPEETATNVKTQSKDKADQG